MYSGNAAPLIIPKKKHQPRRQNISYQPSLIHSTPGLSFQTTPIHTCHSNRQATERAYFRTKKYRFRYDFPKSSFHLLQVLRHMKKTIFGLTAAFFVTAASANTPIPDVSPVSEGQHVVINIPQQRLFLYTDGKLTKIYPVAVGKAMTQTTLGEHKIGAKAFNPTWHIPKSIQKERGDGVKSVPAGPNNPLGPVFVRLGDPKLGLGIHGTNAPASVPGVRSHGCVRMKSPDALEFAKTNCLRRSRLRHLPNGQPQRRCQPKPLAGRIPRPIRQKKIWIPPS